MFKLQVSSLLPAVAFCLVALLPSCGDDDTKVEEVTAGFTYEVDTGTKGKIVFTNTSKNAETYAWDFGDGNTSDEENPAHTYTKDSIYTVKLTATNGKQSDEATKTIDLTAGTDVIASFTYKKDTVDKGKIVFTNTSKNAKTYTWDFGEGSKSDEVNPTHTYIKEGTYTVTLTATNGKQSDEATKTLSTAPVPIITLKGDASITLEIGAEYKDAGATALDVFDKDLTDKIVVGGDVVNTFQPGTYVITYDVEDEKGNKALQVTRTVKVNYDQGLLTNGAFQGGANGWTLNGAGVEIKTEGANSYLHANGGTDSTKIYAFQTIKGDELHGNIYHLSFNASSAAAKTIGVGLQNGSSFDISSKLKMFKTFDLSTENQRFTYEMTILSVKFSDPNPPNGTLFFTLGGAAGSVKIDNVAFELIEKAKLVTKLPADFEDGRTFGETSSLSVALSIVANPSQSGNPSANVLKVVRGPEDSKLTSYFLNKFPTKFKLEDGLLLKVKVWSHKKGATVVLILSDLSSEDGVFLTQSIAAAETWVELTFDLSDAKDSAGKNLDLAASNYTQISINPDLLGADMETETFYFDDIEQVNK